MKILGVATAPEPDAYARRRATVQAFLAERSDRLGGLYGLACGLMEDHRPEGWEHIVAHVARELMNRLADYIAEVPLVDPGATSGRLRPQDGNDGLHWPRRDGLKWPRLASVVVGVDVA